MSSKTEQNQTPVKHTRLFQTLIIAILVIRMFLMILGRWIETDIWFILSMGREISKNGVPQTNPFFFGPEIETLVPQWLYDVLMYQIQSHFGYTAMLSVLVISIIIGSVFLYRIARMYRVDKFISILLIVAYWYINTGILTARPNVVSVMLCIVQIYLLEEYSRSNRLRWLLPIPFISILEINLHCSMWAMHLCILAAYICPQIRLPISLEKHDYKLKPLIYTTAFAFTGGLLNPYGLRAMLFLRGAITPDTTSVIREMLPASLDNGETLGMIICAGVIIHLCTKKTVRYQHFYLFLGWLYLGCHYSRNFAWAFLGILVVAFTFLKDTDFHKRYVIITPKTLLGFWPLLLILVIAVIIRPRAITAYESDIDMPRAAVEYIKEHSPECDRIFNEYNSGGYFEWYGFKTYMDTRADAFMPAYTGGRDIFHEYVKAVFYDDLANIELVVDKYDFEYAYTYETSRLYMYFMQSPDYEYVLSVRQQYDTDGYKVDPADATKGVLFRRVAPKE